MQKSFDNKWVTTTTTEYVGGNITQGKVPYVGLLGRLESTIAYGPSYSDWKGRLQRNEDCTTSMDVEAVKSRYNPATVAITVQDAPIGSMNYMMVHSYNPYPQPRLPWTWAAQMTRVEAQARMSFLANASKEAKVQGAIFLGEVREARNLLESLWKDGVFLTNDFLDNVRAARIGINRLNHRAVRKMNSAYLEYTFGIMPLISDIQDAIEQIQRLQKHPNVKLVRGSSETRVNWPSTHYDPDPLMHQWQSRFRETSHTDVEFHYSGAVKPQIQFVPGSFVNWGLNPRDVAYYAWNLTKYSWAVDYFINVGQFLSVDWDIQARLPWVQSVEYSKVIAERTDQPFGASWTNNDLSTTTVSSVSTGLSMVERTWIKRRREDPKGLSRSVNFKLPSKRQVANLVSVLIAKNAQKLLPVIDGYTKSKADEAIRAWQQGLQAARAAKQFPVPLP